MNLGANLGAKTPATALYFELRERHSTSELAAKLSLHLGTLKRWEERNCVPNDYLFDLNFLLGDKYEIAKENFRCHDEFFTKSEVAAHCLNRTIETLRICGVEAADYTFIEPSCGDGSFYDLLPKNRRVGIDLSPKNSEILRQNFLSFNPQDFRESTPQDSRQDSPKDSPLRILPRKNRPQKYLVLGNPPFGLRGNLALRFLNHASAFADFVAFILPPLFDSDGKGAPKKRVQNLTLISSEKLPLNSFIYPNGREVAVATIFQIWVNDRLLDFLNIAQPRRKTCKEFIKIYSLSDGGTSASTRNKHMLHKCDLYLPSTCFHSSRAAQMRIYEDFESLPHRRGYGIVILRDKIRVKAALKGIDWEKISFLGTNSSLNLRTSLIENALIELGFCDRGLF